MNHSQKDHTVLCRHAGVVLAAFLSLFFSTAVRGDLLINGDFEAGDIGFTSEYVSEPINTDERQYTVRADPQNWNGVFAATPDHTSGTGKMLVVNGATDGDYFLWQQSVSVSPATQYTFSAWVSTAVAGGPAVLSLAVNGTQLGSPFTAPADPGTWDNWSISWSSGGATEADIRIFNLNLSEYPNDFYVDDISFSAVPEPSSFALLALSLAAVIAPSVFRRRNTHTNTGK